MDYKQHKGNLRGQIKNQVERKLYNKRIRAEAIDVDTSEGQLTIPDVSVAKRTVCKPCNGTGGNSGLGIAYFKCVHCNGTGLQTER